MEKDWIFEHRQMWEQERFIMNQPNVILIRNISEKLNNQDFRSIEVSMGNKRIKYFPDKNIIIKKSGSATDSLDIAKDDTDIYSNDENPKEKKIANKIINYTLGNKKLMKEKLKVRRSKIIKHRVIIPGDSRRSREDLVKSELEYSDVSDTEEES
jgi:hypothetical protein